MLLNKLIAVPGGATLDVYFYLELPIFLSYYFYVNLGFVDRISNAGQIPWYIGYLMKHMLPPHKLCIRYFLFHHYSTL